MDIRLEIAKKLAKGYALDAQTNDMCLTLWHTHSDKHEELINELSQDQLVNLACELQHRERWHQEALNKVIRLAEQQEEAKEMM